VPAVGSRAQIPRPEILRISPQAKLDVLPEDARVAWFFRNGRHILAFDCREETGIRRMCDIQCVTHSVPRFRHAHRSERRAAPIPAPSPLPQTHKTHINLAAAGFSITTQLPPERQVAWRTLGEDLLRLLDDRGNGLVITVDEIHAADRTELAQLAASVQHFIQDRLPIALVFAGLPAAVSDLLNEGVATFLRRADKIDLHAAAVREVEESFAGTFADAAFKVSPALVRQAAEATGGYPFLIQLVGYFLWKEAENNHGNLSPETVKRAIEAANRRNARTVIEAAVAAISPKDLDFLRAMAEDDGPSVAGDIGRRIGARTNLVANYRLRLLAAGLIEATAHGKVDFAIPGLRQHLRAQTRP
jgi:hypothetical protein